LRLVCFPPAGGSASLYRNWRRWLPDDIDMLAVQYPGRQDRLNEPCIDTMDLLVTGIAEAFVQFLGLPVAMFGHSMGASVAHEVASRLEQLPGFTLDTLFVSARVPPKHIKPRNWRGQDDEAFIADIRRLDGVNVAILDDPDIRALMMPAIRADYCIADTYRPRSLAPLGAPVVAYVGDQDPDVSVRQLRDWSEITDAGFDVAVFPGGHFYLIPAEAELVHDVVRRLEVA
jgi:pyochelin biosynthetic protein PchC